MSFGLAVARHFQHCRWGLLENSILIKFHEPRTASLISQCSTSVVGPAQSSPFPISGFVIRQSVLEKHRLRPPHSALTNRTSA
jgi:hypothetical protein